MVNCVSKTKLVACLNLAGPSAKETALGDQNSPHLGSLALKGQLYDPKQSANLALPNGERTNKNTKTKSTRMLQFYEQQITLNHIFTF